MYTVSKNHYVEDNLQKQLNLKNKAKSHSTLLYSYLENIKINKVCIIPPLRTFPPIIPNSYPMCRYTQEEWNNAVINEMKLLEDKKRLSEKMNKMFYNSNEKYIIK